MRVRAVGRGLVALVVPLLCGGLVAAGDSPAYSGAPVTVGGMPCKNCAKVKTEAGSDCPTCVNGKYGIGWRKKPTIPTLAPGACFGYFPTQWNKWQDVCPIPYPGAGVTDPPPVPPRRAEPEALPVEPKTDGKTAPAPRPATDPKPADKDAKPADKGGKPAELPKTDGGLKPADPPKSGSLPLPGLPPIPEPPGGKFLP